MLIIRMSRTLAVAAIAICFSSCEVDSKHPLSDPDLSRPDSRLYGTWIVEEKDKDDTGVIFIGRPAETKNRKDVPSGIMRATITGIKKQFVDRPQEVALFVTQLRDGGYINMFDGAALDQSKHKTWDKRVIKGYTLMKYCVSDDKLEIWTGDVFAVQDVIKTGKLHGDVRRNSARFTDTTANLTRYIESGGGRDLFSDDEKPLVLIRVRIQ
jgi:hypothetical protein